MGLYKNIDNLASAPKSAIDDKNTKGTAQYGNTVFAVSKAEIVVNRKVAHTGWVKVKRGTGQRAGRVQYEVLVATGITGDATPTDDLTFPNI